METSSGPTRDDKSFGLPIRSMNIQRHQHAFAQRLAKACHNNVQLPRGRTRDQKRERGIAQWFGSGQGGYHDVIDLQFIRVQYVVAYRFIVTGCDFATPSATPALWSLGTAHSSRTSASATQMCRQARNTAYAILQTTLHAISYSLMSALGQLTSQVIQGNRPFRTFGFVSHARQHRAELRYGP